MKSLNIVNRKIEQIENYKHTDKSKQAYNIEEVSMTITYKQMQQIKADLEVLEIIYKKEVDIGYIKDLVKRFSDNDHILERYNATWDIVHHLTMEELYKIKQWLEVNDND